MLTITPDGVRRPVAVGRADVPAGAGPQAARQGPADARGPLGREAGLHGQGVTGRTLGVVGLGNIGREVLPPGRARSSMRHLAYDPHVTPDSVPRARRALVRLTSCCASRISSCVCCALTPETQHLIDADAAGADEADERT